MAKQTNVLDFLPVAEHAGIVGGISHFDCSTGIQKAIDSSDRVFLPAGVYFSRQLNLKSGVELFGEGASSEIRAYDATTACEFLLATHVRDGGSENPAENMRNIHIHDLKLSGRVAEFGYEPFYYLLAVNATSDMLIERVTFYGSRGDGLYLGSGTLRNLKRYNQRVKVLDCVFDGVSKNNRNGLSVIDCDQLTVDGCTFQNIGNSKLSASVGAIDIEPNHAGSICRAILITRCIFKDIDSRNTAAITFHNYLQGFSNIRDWTITDCHFENCYWGVSCSAREKTRSDVADDLVIANCQFHNIVRTAVAINGLSGTRVSACTFDSAPPGFGPGGDAIRLGTMRSSSTANAINAVITGNYFVGIRPQLAVIGILGVEGLVCAGNHFVNVLGACVGFPARDSGGSDQSVEAVILSGNTVTDSGIKVAGRVVETVFLKVGKGAAGIASDVSLDDSSFEYNNKLGTGVRASAGSAIQFRGSSPR